MKIIKVDGGLGNQLFQVALYYKLKRINKEVYLDLSSYDIGKIHNGWEVSKIFNLDLDIKQLKKTSILKYKIIKKLKKWDILYNFLFKLKKRKEFSFLEYVNNFNLYRKDLQKNLKKNFGISNIHEENIIFEIGEFRKTVFDNKSMYLLGCFQSEKYFSDIEEEIRKIYKFDELEEEKNIKIKKIIEEENSVSIHIRRGDYLNDPLLGGMIDLEYYEKAIELIEKKEKDLAYIIFSNDIEWCKKNLKNLEKAYFVDWNIGEKSYRDIQLMSLCKHNIIPNSTFSWWGAWLNKNKNKIVIAPKNWLRKEVKINDIDIIPDTWLKIDNKF